MWDLMFLNLSMIITMISTQCREYMSLFDSKFSRNVFLPLKILISRIPVLEEAK